jgi:F0F1-type ATP synthase membrane subunit c/vacuolar-type H+-ATPase subunit K
MRSFVAACLIAAAIAVGAAAVLDAFLQQSASAAFAEGSVRL